VGLCLSKFESTVTCTSTGEMFSYKPRIISPANRPCLVRKHLPRHLYRTNPRGHVFALEHMSVIISWVNLNHLFTYFPVGVSIATDTIGVSYKYNCVLGS